MAPGILVPEPSAATATPKAARNDESDRSIFPDGIRTSDQHNPIYSLLEPYANFPKEITGPTVWHKEQFESDPGSWTHHLTSSEINELSAAADAFIASGTDLTGISKLNFPLPGSLGANDLQRRHADVAELLTRPVWYFDRKGEVSERQEGWTRQPVFYMEPSSGKQRRVFCKFDPYYVRSLARFSDQGLVPPLSGEQQRAIEILEETCQRLALHMVLDVGDIQFLSNAHILHARTAYKDYPPPAPRRHLLRLWLATPENEGGWVLPFPDSGEKKRGGIQVDDNPPRCPLDAE
ncbi:hypothetical protein MAPG_11598 [Magnaporthiopsis poae ATCC 64411]|uniref:TauD/TfdA-like domain-containing protein n=1 Tax=Magnaporthiopsis poae (strain ATCC 64411 / 73-15) TaxID=644358 RepID=A0A0C4EFP3_MAGP6|nr:hypothetical protein MAPG_11598 [Magnaporthiopsis poae ATCC 64411]